MTQDVVKILQNKHFKTAPGNATKTKIMKTILKLVIVLLLNVANLFAQGVTVNVSHDAKLLFFGDDHGNKAGTPDIQFSSEWRTPDRGMYVFIRPEVEVAELKSGSFRRYSANFGVTFTELTPIVHYTASVGYGIIDFHGARPSWGANFQISYEIANGVEFFIDWQIAERKDLLQYDSTNEIAGTAFRGSGLFGVKVTVFRPKQ